LSGDLGFFKEIYDRTEGKALQRQEIDSKISGSILNLTEDQIKQIDKTLEENI